MLVENVFAVSQKQTHMCCFIGLSTIFFLRLSDEIFI